MRQRLLILGAALVMWGSFVPLGTSAQTPVATPGASPVSTGGAWQVMDAREIELDALLFSLSPDGRWLAGWGPDNELCVWNVETMVPRCVGQAPNVLPDTVAWAPDSSAIAFSQLGLGRLQEPGGSDILVFNVAKGVLRNLTDPNEGIATPDAENQTRIDVYPTWSPDGDELVFARLQQFGDEETVIMRISRDGGEPETVVNTGLFAVGPLHWVAGDRIFYGASGPAEADTGIWEVGLDGGSPRQVMPGGEADEVHQPGLVDVAPDGSLFSVYAGSFLGMRESDNVYAVVDSETGDVQTFAATPANSVFMPLLLSSPSFSPDGQWLVAITMDGFGAEFSLGLWEPGTGGPSIRIPLEDTFDQYCCARTGLSWANNNTVLLPGPGGGTLITLELTSGSSASDSLAASPVAAESNWQVTDIRDVEVEGTPIALSPDGRWLAGTGEDSHQVCAWNVETLASTCAEVAGPVRPWIGNGALRWAPDSSAFAFVEDGRWRMGSGDVYVFEVATGDLTNLTNTGGVTEGGPLYIGADWTSDSQQVVFEVLHRSGNSTEPYELVLIDRAGGELESIPLPPLPESYYVMFKFPPLVGGDAVFVPISSDPEVAGIWRVPLDGAEPVQVVKESGDPPVDEAMPVSGTRDGRYVNVVSMTGFRRLQLDGTFSLLDTESGELLPLVSEGSVGMIAFAPEGDVGLMVQERNGEDRLSTIDPETGEIAPVANSPVVDPWLATILVWAGNNTVFIPTDEGGVLFTLDPVG